MAAGGEGGDGHGRAAAGRGVPAAVGRACAGDDGSHWHPIRRDRRHCGHGWFPTKRLKTLSGVISSAPDGRPWSRIRTDGEWEVLSGPAKHKQRKIPALKDYSATPLLSRRGAP